jgi:hypothetical protein
VLVFCGNSFSRGVAPGCILVRLGALDKYRVYSSPSPLPSDLLRFFFPALTAFGVGGFASGQQGWRFPYFTAGTVIHIYAALGPCP